MGKSPVGFSEWEPHVFTKRRSIACCGGAIHQLSLRTHPKFATERMLQIALNCHAGTVPSGWCWGRQGGRTVWVCSSGLSFQVGVQCSPSRTKQPWLSSFSHDTASQQLTLGNTQNKSGETNKALLFHTQLLEVSTCIISKSVSTHWNMVLFRVLWEPSGTLWRL